MTKQEADFIGSMNMCDEISNEAYKKIMCHCDVEPCEDCISRESVIRLVEQYPNIIGNRCSGLIADIKHLPPVTPQSKIGQWIDVETLDSAIWHECSECGETEFYATEYCPNCGAKMEVEE